MRILVSITARRDAAYDNAYHHKLRGRIWQALADSPYDDRHDAPVLPGFSYSNPFPPRDMREGDERTLIVASPDEQLLSYIAADLLDDRELNIGDMPFRVEDVRPLDPDVGPPGTSGVLETGTGILVELPPWSREQYGITELDQEYTDRDARTYWRPRHTTAPFFEQLTNNLDRKHGRFGPADQPGPSDADGQLFDAYELIKKYSLPVQVTTEQSLTVVVTKWRFEYRVRDEHHRRHLNLALDTGLGDRNALGFGFMNDREGIDGLDEIGAEAGAG